MKEPNPVRVEEDPYPRLIYELLSRVFSTDSGTSLGNHITVIKDCNFENYYEGSPLNEKARKMQEAVKKKVDEKIEKVQTHMITHALDENPQEIKDARECRPKPLLPLNEFDKYISKQADKERVCKRLHELIDGKRGKTVAYHIRCAVDLGMLCEKPTYRAVMHEFGDIGSKENFNKYYRQGPYEDDRARIIALLTSEE